jgi:glutathione reductase (NADPH)
VNKTFDLVAIGTGSAASTAASRCRRAGWKVAIVDSRPFGGTCALRGCDPKKVLVGAAEVVDWVRRMSGKGIQGEQVRIRWNDLMAFKRTFTEPVPKRREEALARAGIETFHGRARFVGTNAVQVGEDVLEGRYILIAAGQKPADLRFPGSEYLITSDQFLELEDLPKKLLFIGGGYIGFEFAHLAARAGAEVTILHRGKRPLPRFERDLVDLLVEFTRTVGIDVQVGVEAQGVERVSNRYRVTARAEGKTLAFEADLVVHAAGRVPEIDDLNLEVAGVEWDRRGVKVNDFLQSISNPAVYAAGDAAATAGPPLTPVAGYEGAIVAANLLEGPHQKPDYRGIPTAVFTIPPLASVGLSEQAAREQGFRFRVKMERTSDWYSSRRTNQTCSAYKTILEEDTDRLLGAHLLGEQAPETINLFAAAIRLDLPAAALRRLLYAYPTHASDIPYML